MNKLKRMTALILTAGVLTLPAFAKAEEPVNEPVSTTSEEKVPYYLSFTGKVLEMSNLDNGTTLVRLNTEDKQEADFALTKDTYCFNDLKVEVGMELTGYYESGRPMIMIYPPRYTISVLTKAKEELNVKVDRFDENLTSQDNMLKLNLSDLTEIDWRNETINWFTTPTVTQISAVLANRSLLVLYDVSTRSIPAQTTPKKIIVLSSSYDIGVEAKEITEIKLKDQALNTPKSYVNAKGVAMIPLRAVAEAMGFEISWQEETQSVLVGESIRLTVGADRYELAGAATLSLGNSPELSNGSTYVPLSFLSQVLRLKTVVLSDTTLYLE